MAKKGLWVAIIGRPNVGKSALFNKIAEKRISIVDETEGVTRDRIFADCSWRGTNFSLIDTGGLEFKNSGSNIDFLDEVKNQTEVSILQADIILFIVDLHCNVTSIDFEIANLLRKSKKKVIVCVNKCDKIGNIPAEFYDFYSLGFNEIFAISAIHGYGVGDLLDCIINNLPKSNELDDSNNSLKIAMVGRPNVGKSSILNKILGQDRTIVSSIAGTTRDAIDVDVEQDGYKFTLIDTAGIIRKSVKVSNVEHYSMLRTYMAIERANLCLIVIDFAEGLLEQDIKIAGYCHRNGKGCLILVNKIDLIEDKSKKMKEFDEKLKISLNFMDYVQHIYVSAKTGQRLNKLFDISRKIQLEREKRLSTGVLNSLLSFCVSKVPPPNFGGNQLKIYYITQVGVNPPTFVFFVNKVEYFHFSYKRYLENQIRLAFGFKGTPIKIVIRTRNED